MVYLFGDITIDTSLNIAEIPYEDGSIRFRYSRRMASDGSKWIRHGLFRAYHPNGKLASKGQYEDGLETGLWISYHTNGQKAAEGYYKDGKAVGVWSYNRKRPLNIFRIHGEEYLSMIFGFLSMVSAGLFSGAAIYINLVEHPARMSCGAVVAVTEFRPSYKRAAVMQASLAAFGMLNAVIAWFLGGGLSWLIGGILLGSVIPFTLIVIFPTNRQLLDVNLDKNSDRAFRLLTRWGKLHAVRSILSFVAFTIFLSALL